MENIAMIVSLIALIITMSAYIKALRLRAWLKREYILQQAISTYDDFTWEDKRIIVNSYKGKRLYCLTFNCLYRDLEAKIEAARQSKIHKTPH